jgi:hypothetical protein
VQSPVVLIVFNRAEPTRRVFARIAEARPRRLFVIADGPRNSAEARVCETVRSIATRISWPCELVTDFSSSHLGCRKRVVSGLRAAFDAADRAIILEDDCVPHPRFFSFCDELLERLQGEDRVMEIGGANYLPQEFQSDEGFYFSRFVHNHGWATWRRAWNRFDESMSAWPALRDSGFLDSICHPLHARHLRMVFDRTRAGQIDTWDYQWQVSMWANDGLAAVPNANLISNIGFGPHATHTHGAVPALAGLPLGHLRATGATPCIQPDQRLDRIEEKFAGHTGAQALWRVVRAYLSSPLRQPIEVGSGAG